MRVQPYPEGNSGPNWQETVEITGHFLRYSMPLCGFIRLNRFLLIKRGKGEVRINTRLAEANQELLERLFIIMQVCVFFFVLFNSVPEIASIRGQYKRCSISCSALLLLCERWTLSVVSSSQFSQGHELRTTNTPQCKSYCDHGSSTCLACLDVFQFISL